MSQPNENSNPESTPFLMFYTSNWIAATWRYTLEQKGFYSSALFLMWEMKAGLPDDIRWLGSAFNCDPRIAKRLRDFLIAERKLESRDGFLVNRRMMRMIARYLKVQKVVPPTQRTDDNGYFGPMSDVLTPLHRPYVGGHLSGFHNEISDGDPPISYSRSHRSEEENLPSSSIKPRGGTDEDVLEISDLEFSKQLIEAGGGVLALRSQSLGSMVVPRKWLADGCDLARDVLPALRAVSRRMPADSVRSWGYFSAEVLANKRENERAPIDQPRRKGPIEEDKRARLRKLGELAGLHPAGAA